MEYSQIDDANLVSLSGVVERITYHNSDNGWTVLKLSPFNEPHRIVPVVVHQAKVFAGSSMEFKGAWIQHPKYGEQFKAESSYERKPASSAALEKYLGSGLIKGVGPKTAKKIVRHFSEETLDVFEDRIDDLLEVPGIAQKKLIHIKDSWEEHKSIRDVMIFLQGYGISTLYAVKIFKTYGSLAIDKVSENPYCLAKDIYGIGFFSADKIALKMGFEPDGMPRVQAGIKHILAAARDEGHCYLTEEQIVSGTEELLEIECRQKVLLSLETLLRANEIKNRTLEVESRSDATSQERSITGYYHRSLFYDEKYVAERVSEWIRGDLEVDTKRIQRWILNYCVRQKMQLSNEQKASIQGVVTKKFSILTGGPGCGKTTTTKAIARLHQARGMKVILSAPTGRAAQRMSEVIGLDAKTIHRLLEWSPSHVGFKKNEDEPLKLDVIIIDECSMLDINLAAALFKAIPKEAQVLLIGDPDQLPSVGAGNVLRDLIECQEVPVYRLTKVFRQAEESAIIRYAHQINLGGFPRIPSPFHNPQLLKEQVGCLFVDAEEATQEQIRFLQRAKHAINNTVHNGQEQILKVDDEVISVMRRDDEEKLAIDEISLMEPEAFSTQDINTPLFVIPKKFRHLDLQALCEATTHVSELRLIIQNVHDWSALHYGMTALDVVLKMYTQTINKYYGSLEIQVLSPQTRGSLGTLNLNKTIQNAVNPLVSGAKEIKIGDRILREGDRVIQTRNNYNLEVFNGDIGHIRQIDLDDYCCSVKFGTSHEVTYTKEDLVELSLAYSITIHKSQGSEFDAVIIPIAPQHYKMLFRNLIYTGLTRAKRLCIFVGSRKALYLATKQLDKSERQTALRSLIA